MTSEQGDGFMRIALLQMNSSAEPADNMKAVAQAFADAAKLNAELLVLPENFLAMAAPFAQLQTIDWSCYIHELQGLATQHHMACVAGSLPLASSDDHRRIAASLFIDDNGNIMAQYNKIHLFDVDIADEKGRYRESDYYCPGQQPVLVNYKGINFGLSVCFDLRFSSLFQYYRQQGAEVLLVPSAFTALTGQKHWQLLLQARAVENQCYVIGVNQCGAHADGRKTWGHSMLVDPDGQILLEAGQEPQLMVADIDTQCIKQVRQSIPMHPQVFGL